ncbi:MAG: hypothetical protein ACM3MI_11570 [Clostridiales bacterium]
MKEVKIDSLSYTVEIDTVHYAFYAKFDGNGNCLLIQNDSNDHFKTFKIERAILTKALKVINEIKNDTLLTTECTNCIYDGPSIHLIKLRNGERPLEVTFGSSERSNQDLLMLYKYIDGKILKLPLKENLETSLLLKSRNLLIERIIKKEKQKYTPYKITTDKIKFTKPDRFKN